MAKKSESFSYDFLSVDERVEKLSGYIKGVEGQLFEAETNLEMNLEHANEDAKAALAENVRLLRDTATRLKDKLTALKADL